MSRALKNLTPGASFTSLLTISSNKLIADFTTRVGDGSGIDSPLSLATNKVDIDTNRLHIGGVQVIATANQINKLYRTGIPDGVTTPERALVTDGAAGIDMSGARVHRAYMTDRREQFVDHGTRSTNVDVHAKSGYFHRAELIGSNVALSLGSIAPSGQFQDVLILFEQDSVGNREVTWPNSISWFNNRVPGLSNFANNENIFRLYTTDGGVSWRGHEITRGIRTIANLYPHTVELPSSNGAITRDIKGHKTLIFGANTDTSGMFPIMAPADFTNGAFNIKLVWFYPSGTNGDVRWAAHVDRMQATHNIYGPESFDTLKASTTALFAAQSSGVIQVSNLVLTPTSGADLWMQSEAGRLKIIREASHASDTLLADVALLRVELREI